MVLWDETLGVYRVDHEIMQRHIFDFRSEVKTGNGPFDMGIISVRKVCKVSRNFISQVNPKK